MVAVQDFDTTRTRVNYSARLALGIGTYQDVPNNGLWVDALERRLLKILGRCKMNFSFLQNREWISYRLSISNTSNRTKLAHQEQ